MSRRLLVFVFSCVLVGTSVGLPSLAAPIQESTAVIEGGERDVLRGVNRSGTEYACVQGWGVFDGPVDTRAIDAMAGWGVEAVRVPLNESCWLGHPDVPDRFGGAAYRREIVAYAERLAAAGMTVVLDLHWSSATGVARAQDAMANRSHSIPFWSSVAATFAAHDEVVFDVFNEPHGMSWRCWRDGCGGMAGMQELVDAIRSAGATQPIVLSGLEWGNDLRGWWENRPNDPLDSLVAGVHVYQFNRCVTPGCWDREIAPVAARVPVMITEFGAGDCRGAWAESLMTWADAHDVSYLAWTWNPWDCAGGPALIASFDGEPTAYGRAVRDHLRRGSRGPFVDDDHSVHEGSIETLARAGITRGCNPPRNDRYCPEEPLTRGEAAAFFTRALDLGAGRTDVFDDDDASPFSRDIDALASSGISKGCDPPSYRRFCPDDPISRAEWASFLVRALDLPAAHADAFVDDDGVHEEDIDRLAAAGLTFGCDPPHGVRYCPDAAVTRGQAASFFARALAVVDPS